MKEIVGADGVRVYIPETPEESQELVSYQPVHAYEHTETEEQVKSDILAEITDVLTKATSGRIYVDDASEIPEGYEAQEGPRGGTFYEPEDSDVESPERPEQPQEAPTEEPAKHTPNPEQDIPRFEADEEMDKRIDAVNETPEWGLTLHRDLQPQELGSEDAWMVAVSSAEFNRELSKPDFIEAYNEHLELLTEYTGIRMGAWHFQEGGRYSVDFNVALTDKEEAVKLGNELDQEGVFNIGTEEYEYLGNSGHTPERSTEELRDLISNLQSLSEKALRMVSAMTKSNSAPWDKSGQYVGENGETLSFFQIAMRGVKGGAEVLKTEDGYVVDGELFTPAEEPDGNGE